MPVKKRIQFVTEIEAPPSEVYDLIVGPESYKRWTSAFLEGSYFEGSWGQGEKIRFLSPSGDGMIAEIAENRRGEFISIRHLGVINKGVEDTESEDVRAWTPAFENYTLEPVDAGTRLVVDQDVTDDFESYMQEAWPKALAKLKELAEDEHGA